MKVVLILATLFIFVSMLLNAARNRGKLDDKANRAVAGLASSMRIFVYGLLFFVGVVCLAVAYQSL
jgi:preprotein translocase subunit SecG